MANKLDKMDFEDHKQYVLGPLILLQITYIWTMS